MRLMNFPMDGHACPLKFGSCELLFFLNPNGMTFDIANDPSVTELLTV